MKIREYLACGLPVITTPIPSTADDIEKFKAGFVINLERKELELAIKTLLTNQKQYLLFRKNALSLAKKFDIQHILKNRLANLITSKDSSI